MKTHKVLFLALIVGGAFAVSAQAGDRHRSNNGSQVAPSRGRSSSSSFSSGSGFRSGNRTFAPSPRMTSRSMPTTTFSQRSTFNSSRNVPSFSQRRFTPETFNRSNGLARFQNNENFERMQGNRVNRFSSLGNSNRGLNSTVAGNRFTRFQNNRPIQTNRFTQMQGQRGNRTAQLGTGRGNRIVGNISPGHNHVFAQQSVGWHRDWDRDHDHFWNGHRCRFVNGSWFIFDVGFFPWFGWPFYDSYAYDYYPYGYPYYGYGYPSGYGYDSGAYGNSYYNQNGYDPSYDQGNYDSPNYGRNGNGSSDQSAAVQVADVQDVLSRKGYYHGQIDGVVGPEMRHALLRYQSDKGLEPSGTVTNETLRSLGLQRVAQE